MTVVDSSVWIDLLQGRRTHQVEWLREAASDIILMPDLVLMEVLQGARDDRDAARIRVILQRYPVVAVGGEQAAHRVAIHFRALRSQGIRLRRQIDLIVGSFCIAHRHELLHADRDFNHLVRHLGLRAAAGSLPAH